MARNWISLLFCMWTKNGDTTYKRAGFPLALSLALHVGFSCSFFAHLSVVLMSLSKQRCAIPTRGLGNLHFAVIGLPTVNPIISPEKDLETMNLPTEQIRSLVCGRLWKSSRHQGWECRWNAGRGTRERCTFGQKQRGTGRLFFSCEASKRVMLVRWSTCLAIILNCNLKKNTYCDTNFQSKERMMNSASLVLGLDLQEKHEEHFLQLRDS